MLGHRLPRAAPADLKKIETLASLHSAAGDLELINYFAQLDVFEYRPEMKFFFKAYDNALCNRVWNSCKGYDFRRVLQKLDCPHFVLYGENDFIYKSEIDDYLIGAKRAFGLPKTGHHPYTENPKEFFEHLSSIDTAK
jgi:pimeloyl-ACP methyl ester carboxylesterase